MAIDYSKWDKTYNISEEEVKEMEQKNGQQTFDEVPLGKYEAKVTLLELTSTKKEGKPMISVRFKILKGSQKGRVIFYNKVVTSTAQIHFADEFLRSLDSGVEIKWTGSYRDYADTIQQVFDEIEDSAEYAISYENEKGYDTVKILEVFDVE